MMRLRYLVFLFVTTIWIFVSGCRSKEKQAWKAASEGNTNAIARFIKQGGDLNVRVEYNCRELFDHLIFAAAKNAQLEVIRQLLQAGASPTVTNASGDTALMLLMYAYNTPRALECMVTLINADKRLINMTNRWGDTVLHEAALRADKEYVQLLVDNGADVNAANIKGGTPLGLSIAKNLPNHEADYKIITEILLKAGAKR